MMQRNSFNIGLFVILTLLVSACSFEPGPGGTGAIQGKIFVEDYDAQGGLVGMGYAPDWDVYIQYGADSIIGDKTETSFDGVYKFDFLHEGDYKVYAYSKCSTCINNVTPVIKEVSLPKGELIILEDIVVFD